MEFDTASGDPPAAEGNRLGLLLIKRCAEVEEPAEEVASIFADLARARSSWLCADKEQNRHAPDGSGVSYNCTLLTGAPAGQKNGNLATTVSALEPNRP